MHLLVAVSGHGFGHLAQVAPVLTHLVRLRPALQVTVRSALPEGVLRRRLPFPFTHQAAADDFGMVMHDALSVDAAASAQRYRELHRHWPQRVGQVARQLASLRPDLLFADAPYLTLAAAAQAGIPAVAMCCLNWADIYGHYCGERPEAAQIHSEMLAAYNSAQVFLRTEPAMPMAGLNNLQTIGPVAGAGNRRRAELDERFGLADGERLVLVGMGGVAFRLPMESWPRMPGVRFVVQADWGIRHPDVLTLEETGMPFGDLLASCDAVLTKPGYGTFAEAALAGVPVLYVSRGDWPEEPWLVRWLQERSVCHEVAREVLLEGALAEAIASAVAVRRPPIVADGVGQAADVLSKQLR